MSEWKEYKFSDLLMDESISYGVVQPGFHKDNDSVPLIRVNNIKNGKIRTDDILKIDKTIEEKHLRTRLKGGELLITVVGSVGECAIVPKALAGWNVARAVSVARIKSNFDPDFIRYSFKTEDVIFQMYGNTNDTVQPTLNLSELKSLILKIPPQSEQIQISSTLKSIDDKIDLLDRQILTLENLIEVFFRQWFEIDVKESWQIKPLSSIANFLNGLACQKFPPKNELDRLPVLKIKDLSSGITENSDWASGDVKPEYVVKNGDIIFAWSASLMVKIWDGEDCVLNQHLFKVSSDEYPKWYYYLWCKYHLPEFIAKAAGHATTMGHIKRGDLDQAMVIVPSPLELKEMTKQMAPPMDKIIANHSQIATLTSLRNTLLPKLMSGDLIIKSS